MAKGGRRNGAGHPKKPTAMKVVQGTFRQDRHDGEPVAPSVWPSPPEFLQLSASDLKIWQALGLQSAWHAVTDWPSIWGLVRLIARLQLNHEAQLETDTSGHPLAFRHILQEKDGKTLEIVTAESNPLVDQEIKIFDKLRQYIAINGYSPVDRARMPKPGEVKTESPLQKLIGRRRE